MQTQSFVAIALLMCVACTAARPISHNKVTLVGKPVASNTTTTITTSTVVKASGNYYLLRLQTICSGRTTIHGLWPQWAEDCSGDSFDINQLAPIEPTMIQVWPSCEVRASVVHQTFCVCSCFNFFSPSKERCLSFS